MSYSSNGIIALFYSEDLSVVYLGLALLLFLIMFTLEKRGAYNAWIYLIAGIATWFFMYRSGIDPPITGVLLAFAIPFVDGVKKFFFVFFTTSLA